MDRRRSCLRRCLAAYLSRRAQKSGRLREVTGRPTNEAEAIGFLVERVPELRPLHDEHVADNGEVLPYIVFEGVFTRWFSGAVRAGEVEGAAQRFLSAVEVLLATDAQPPAADAVWNLAAVAFVEAAALQDEVVAAALPWFGPRTAAEMSRERVRLGR